MSNLKKVAKEILAARSENVPADQDPSMFETFGKAALPYVQPALEKIAPAVETAAPALNVLGKPQEWATQAADKLAGGTGDATSFADVAERINQKLPENMQNRGLARDMGYFADLAFPVPVPGKKLGETVKMAVKDAKKEQLIKEALEHLAKTRKAEKVAATAPVVGPRISASQLTGKNVGILTTSPEVKAAEALANKKEAAKMGKGIVWKPK